MPRYDPALLRIKEAPDLVDTPPDTEFGSSKSRRKREVEGLQDLGTELVGLPRTRLDALTLPDNLRQAILEAQRITKHEARRRQLQYIGKLMRGVDPEPIRARLADWADGSQAAAARMHQFEQWRDRLLAEDDAFTRFIAQFPEADVQMLRNQVRAARREVAANATLPEGNTPQRKHFRALFQSIRALHETGSDDDTAAKPAANHEDDDDQP